MEQRFIIGKWVLTKAEPTDKENPGNITVKPYSYEFLKDGIYVLYAPSGREFKGKWYFNGSQEIRLLEDRKPEKTKYDYSYDEDESTLTLIKISKDSLVFKEDRIISHFARK